MFTGQIFYDRQQGEETMTKPDAQDETKSPIGSAGRFSVAKWLSALNQPFAVTVAGGAIVFLITSYMQQRYWMAQQDYLFKQESMKFRLAAIDETIKAVDQLLSAEAAEFTAYESDFDQDQKQEMDRERETARSDWDKESDLRKLKIQLYFPDPGIQNAWQKVDTDLATLDCYMLRLGTRSVPQGFGCEELGLAKLSQNTLIAKGRPYVNQTEDDLQKLAKLMVDWASKPH
jgi:hypothetical protein